MASVRLRALRLIATVSCAAAPRLSLAAEATRVVSALDAGKSFDFNLSIAWLHDAKSASIKREYESSFSPGQAELLKDLRYHQTRDVLLLRTDFGVLWDIGLHVELPIVLADSRDLEFDQSEGDGCVFPGDPSGQRPTCVNESNSTLLRDGILPGFGSATYGWDAEHGRPFQRPAPGGGPATVFRGPDRSGIEYLGLGATWAIFNQRRDDTKPTWTLTFDGRFDVAKDMRYDPADSLGNTAVGRGYHELYWATFISKRFRYFDPYFGATYSLPVRSSGSPFQRYPVGSQSNVNPQQTVGAQFGLEHVVWENVPKLQRVTIEYRGRMEARLEGRGMSELWEPLSGSSKCRTDPTACRKDIDLDLDGNGKPDPFPGVTDIETYGAFGGDLGLNVQIGPYIRFRGLFGLTLEQPHFITFANAGTDLDGDMKVDTPAEMNPTYRPIFDLPGRRFRVEQTEIWSLFVEASLMF